MKGLEGIKQCRKIEAYDYIECESPYTPLVISLVDVDRSAQTITFAVTGAEGDVELSVDGRNWVQGLTVTYPETGTHPIYARDSSGNKGSYKFTILPCTLTFDTITSQGSTYGDSTGSYIRIISSSTGASWIEFRIDGGAWNQVATDVNDEASFQFDGISDGDHLVEIRDDQLCSEQQTIHVDPFLIDENPPPAPVIEATFDGVDVNITWSAVVDPESSIDRYQVHRSTVQGFTPDGTTLLASPSAPGYTDPSPAFNTYYYKVLAIDEFENTSTPSNEEEVVISDIISPGAPVLEEVIATSSMSTQITWQVGPEPDIESYNIYRGLAAGFTADATTLIDNVAVGAGPSQVYEDTGLDSETEYFYKIIAIDTSDNWSDVSNELSTTTDAPPVTEKSFSFKIKASQVEDDLTNFPVYLPLGIFGSELFGLVAADGGDIRIFNGSDVELPREVVTIDIVGETGIVYFKADSVSSSVDTYFYLIVGSGDPEPAPTDPNGKNAVWSDYIYVSHDGGLTESSGVGTTPDAELTEVTGIGEVWKATDYRGGIYNSESPVDFSGMTTNNQFVLQLRYDRIDGANNRSVLGITLGSWNNTGWNFYSRGFAGAAYAYTVSGSFIRAGTYEGGGLERIDILHDGVHARMFKEGTLIGENAAIGNPVNNGALFDIGGDNGVGADLEGIIDTIRLRDTIITEGWVQTEINNQTAPETFFEIGDIVADADASDHIYYYAPRNLSPQYVEGARDNIDNTNRPSTNLSPRYAEGARTSIDNIDIPSTSLAPQYSEGARSTIDNRV